MISADEPDNGRDNLCEPLPNAEPGHGDFSHEAWRDRVFAQPGRPNPAKPPLVLAAVAGITALASQGHRG